MAQGKITAKQEEILEYIKSQILERGFPPSVRDICEAVHLNLLLLFTLIWKLLRRMDISEGIQPNHVRLRSWMTLLILTAAKW